MSFRPALPITLLLGLLIPHALLAQDGPDQAVRDILDGLEENRLGVLWNALPPSYQADVEGLRNDFVDQVDRELWTTNFRVLGKVVRVLDEKRGFILGHPAVAPYLTKANDFEKAYSNFVAMFGIILTSELVDLDRLRNTDVGALLAGSVSEMAKRLKAIAEEVPEASGAVDPLSLSGAELVSQDGDQAVVRVFDEDGSKEVEFRRVEGKWLPADLVDDWPDQIAKMREQLKAVPAERSEESKKYLQTLNSLEPALDQVLAADNSEDFNNAVQMLIGAVMGAWMTG